MLRLQAVFGLDGGGASGAGTFVARTTANPAVPLTLDGYVALVRESLARYRELGGSPVQIDITSTQLPVLALLVSPLLTALWVFVYVNGGVAADKGFDVSDYERDYSQVIFETRAVSAAYRATDTREVWGPRPLLPILACINALAESRALSRDTIDAIFVALDAIIAELREASRTGRKAGGGSFELYVCDKCARNTVMTLRGRHGSTTFYTLDGPLYLRTSDAASCAVHEQQFERFRRRARRIGPAYYREYFDQMQAACAKSRASLSAAPVW